MLNKSIFLEGAKIFIRNLNFSEPIEFDINHNFPFIKLQFVLKGHSHYEPQPERGVPVTIVDGQYNLFYLPEVHGKLTIKDEFISAIDIECYEEFFKRLFKNDFFKISSSFGEAIKAKIPFKMHAESQEINSFLKEKIDAIVKNSEQNEVDIVAIETQLIAVFRYLFAHLDQVESNQRPSILKHEERQQVARAESILREHLKDSITVHELAAAVGTNRHKLNRNFKKVYNEPIFSYLTHVRMEEAKLMLIKKEMKVSEVADMIGYKNPQHFTVAFKKHFGYLPSKLTV